MCPSLITLFSQSNTDFVLWNKGCGKHKYWRHLVLIDPAVICWRPFGTLVYIHSVVRRLITRPLEVSEAVRLDVGMVLFFLTWINFNIRLDRLSLAQQSVRWHYLSVPNRQSVYRWSLGMDKWFHPIFYHGCKYLSMLGLKLNHVSKVAPCRRSIVDNVNRFEKRRGQCAVYAQCVVYRTTRCRHAAFDRYSCGNLHEISTRW